MSRFFTRLGEVWSIVGITLLMLVLVEVIFRVYFLFVPTEDTRIQADCYQNAEWLQDYYDEFTQCNTSQWQPYVYWRRESFSGTYINIDEQGYRKTITKTHPLSSNQKEFKLFFFGGSTLWGTGVRDAFTIPSLTGNELIKRGLNPTITNYGESGYVSTQEVLKLITELKNGNIPDIVVFYDGANDVFSSYQSGKPGIPQNEVHREIEFHASLEKKKSLSLFFRSLRTLATVKFISNHLGADPTVIREQKEIDTKRLSSQTVSHYNENIRIVNALAKAYDFQAFFYWQPSIFGKTILSDYENVVLEKSVAMRSLFEEVNGLLFMDDLQYENIRFYNLSDLFRDTREPLFIDWCHVGEQGNLVISQRMARDIIPMMETEEIENNQNNE